MDEAGNTQTCSTNRVVVKNKKSRYLRGGLTHICGRMILEGYAPSDTYGGVTGVYIGDSTGFIVGQNYPVNTFASAQGCP